MKHPVVDNPVEREREGEGERGGERGVKGETAVKVAT